MNISVIIPTLNEEENIFKLVSFLNNSLAAIEYEIIVVDANSSDKTQDLAKEAGAEVVNCKQMSRAFQMNKGAKLAKYEILYFLHADTIPPKDFYKYVFNAIEEDYELGCFRFKFDSKRPLLAFNSYCTRFDKMMFRGGDQSLFIKKEVFYELEGYKSEFKIMEEYEFIARARKKYRFKIIQKDVKVSARKYEENSYLRVNFANFIVFMLFRMGASQNRMQKTYCKLLNHPKKEAFQ